jgi:hypothetical protein
MKQTKVKAIVSRGTRRLIDEPINSTENGLLVKNGEME